MNSFNYEWWTVQILETSGTVVLEVKAKSKDNAIKQINNLVKESNSEKNAGLPWWERKAPIVKVFWETLTLDRVGYQRRY